MRRTLVAIMSVGAAMSLVACEGDRSTSPSPNARPSFDKPAPPLTCSFSTVNSDANAFFVSNDPVFSLISTMKTTYNKSGVAAATPLGFDILARTAAARYTSAQKGTAADGGTFVTDLLRCMDVGGAIPATFDPTAALSQGVFEVRGDVPGAPSALAYNGTANGAKVEFSPRWGVEPRTAAGWPTSSGFAGAPRYLIYGYPTTGSFAGETPAPGFNAFEIGSLPANLSKDGLRVGVCTKVISGQSADFLIHSGALVANESPAFCAQFAWGTTKTTWLARLKSLFMPSNAWAQDDLSRDFIGGGPSGWSPMSWGVVAGSDMVLSFKVQPKNGNISAPLQPFVVHAQTAAGNALQNVFVKVSVANNSGTPAGAYVTGTVTVKTDPSGDATFSDIVVNKAGGYLIGATGLYGTVKTDSTTSTLFNVKNK